MSRAKFKTSGGTGVGSWIDDCFLCVTCDALNEPHSGECPINYGVVLCVLVQVEERKGVLFWTSWLEQGQCREEWWRERAEILCYSEGVAISEMLLGRAAKPLGFTHEGFMMMVVGLRMKAWP